MPTKRFKSCKDNPLRLELEATRNSRFWNDLRLRLLTERGRICEYCHEPIPDKQPFILHHIDYSKGDDPQYLRIVDQYCHTLLSLYGEEEGVRIIERVVENRRRYIDENEEETFWEEKKSGFPDMSSTELRSAHDPIGRNAMSTDSLNDKRLGLQIDNILLDPLSSGTVEGGLRNQFSEEEEASFREVKRGTLPG